MPLVYLSSSGLQYCYSYTEKLYTFKSYHTAYSGYSKLLIIYHDSTCELIKVINDYYDDQMIVFPTHN